MDLINFLIVIGMRYGSNRFSGFMREKVFYDDQKVVSIHQYYKLLLVETN